MTENNPGPPEEKKQGRVKGFFVGLGKSSLVTTTTTLATAGLAKAGLAWAGFSSIGPVAGSFAAGLQASAGNIAAGSWFAFFQSVGMSGFTPLLVPVIPVGVAIGGGYWWLSARNRNQKMKMFFQIDRSDLQVEFSADEIYGTPRKQALQRIQRIDNQKLVDDTIQEIAKTQTEPSKQSGKWSWLKISRNKNNIKQVDNKISGNNFKEEQINSQRKWFWLRRTKNKDNNKIDDQIPKIDLILQQNSTIPKGSWLKQSRQIANKIHNDKEK